MKTQNESFVVPETDLQSNVCPFCGTPDGLIESIATWRAENRDGSGEGILRQHACLACNEVFWT